MLSTVQLMERIEPESTYGVLWNFTVSGSVDPCSPRWQGITCNNASDVVLSLNLTSYNLSGSIPMEIGGLANLTHLQLSYNSINGSLPSSFCSLQSLSSFQASSNSISGSIPTCINSLGELENFLMIDNRVNGSLPLQVCSLSKIGILDVSGNRLESRLRSCVGMLTTLSVLNLCCNNRVEVVGSSIGELNYVKLTNQAKGFFGAIPSTLSELTKLRVFSGQANDLTGSLPNDMWGLTGLQRLDLRTIVCGARCRPPSVSCQISRVSPWVSTAIAIMTREATAHGTIHSQTMLSEVGMQQSASMSGDIPTILGYVDAHLDGVYSEDVQKHEPFQAHAATAIVCDACRYDNHATQKSHLKNPSIPQTFSWFSAQVVGECAIGTG